MSESLDKNELPRILIVDDAKENVRVLSALLKPQGQVIFALDGPSALEKAKQTLPDLILLDVEMPGMSGFEVLSNLQKDPILASIPVIFVTGRGGEQDEAEGLKLGALDYITKPFSPSIVEVRVRNQLLLRHYAQKLERLNGELELLANTDTLTGARNRRDFMENLNKEFDRITRYKRPCSVLMLDIDHFKKINDSYGHDAGDAILCMFHATVAKTLRRQDVLARIGGEEFAILTPETDVNGASVLAEHVLTAVRETPVVVEGRTISCTVSIGIAPMSTTLNSADEALKHADVALYKAKNLGRDQKVLFDPDTSETAA